MICYKYVILWVGLYLQNYGHSLEPSKTVPYSPPLIVWGTLMDDGQHWHVPISFRLPARSGSQRTILLNWQMVQHRPTYIGAEYYSSQRAWGHRWRASAR